MTACFFNRLLLAKDRTSDAAGFIDLDGVELTLCGPLYSPGYQKESPGADLGADCVPGVPGDVPRRIRPPGAGKEKRWWKRLPIVLSHPTRPLHKGHRVVWCYALSDAAKEAWAVAMWQDVSRSRAMMDAAVLSAARAASRLSRESMNQGSGFNNSTRAMDERDGPDTNDGDEAQRTLIDHLRACVAVKHSHEVSKETDDGAFAPFENTAGDKNTAGDAGAGTRETSAGKGSVREVGWSSGGAAAAALNGVFTRIIFDMQRSPEKIAEVRRDLSKLCEGIPDLPKFVGPVSVTRVHLGENVPQIRAARLPPIAPNANVASAAPWDGGTLANRGPCAAVELEMDFAGTAEVVLKTNIDLNVYAEMMREKESADTLDTHTEQTTEAGVSSDSSMGRDSPEPGSNPGTNAERFAKFKSLAKHNASKLIGAVAKKLVDVPVTLRVKLSHLSGTMRFWIPPPPGDRLWFAFVGEPKVEMQAIPTLGELGIRWHGLADKVSALITANLLKELHAALVLPNAGNLLLEPLRPYDGVIPEMDIDEVVRVTSESAAEAAAAKSRSHSKSASPEKEKEDGSDKSEKESDKGSPASPAAISPPAPLVMPEVRRSWGTGTSSSTPTSPKKGDEKVEISLEDEDEDTLEEDTAEVFDTPSNSMLLERPASPTGADAREPSFGEAEEAVAAMAAGSIATPGSVGRKRLDSTNMDLDQWASPSTALGDAVRDRMSEIETDAFAPKSPSERPNDDAKFDPLGGGFKRTGSRDKSTAAGDTNTGGDADGVNPAAGLKLASIFAKKAKEAKARMMSDFDQLREGIKKGGLEGGFDAAKRLTEKAVKEMVPAEEPRQKVDLTKVYGGGQEIPFKVPEGSTSPGPARTHAD